jgi:predicted RNA-binding protein YlqC (UPF0109 family)
MSDLREDFVNYVVKALVSNPDAVATRRVEDDKGEYLELKVDPSDMGKVIGKAGATAKSIRTLLRVVGSKDELPPLPLKIVEPDGETVDVPEVDNGGSEEPAVPVEDHADRHAQTKREAEELADLEL